MLLLKVVLLVLYSNMKTEKTHFLTAPNQVVLQDIKKYFEKAHLDEKCIEFHLPRYEIPQLSPH